MSDEGTPRSVTTIGRVTNIEQTHTGFAAADITVSWQGGVDALLLEGAIQLRGAPAMDGVDFGVKYGPNDADVIFMGDTVRVTLAPTRGAA